MTELTVDVEHMKTDVSLLKTDVSKLQTNVAVLKESVGELKIDVKEIKQGVNTLLTNVDGFLKGLENENHERLFGDAQLERRVERLDTALAAGEKISIRLVYERDLRGLDLPEPSPELRAMLTASAQEALHDHAPAGSSLADALNMFGGEVVDKRAAAT